MTEPLKLDLGCGTRKLPGFVGVDCLEFPGVDLVLNLVEPVTIRGAHGNTGTRRKYRKWPWEDDSVAEVHCSHMVEHLRMSPEEPERVHFVNELYRVLKPGAKAQIVIPNWASQRAYGDYTHRWPPVSEFWFQYLRKAWRDSEAPHCQLYTCDFEITGGHTVHPYWQTRAQEAQMFALTWYRDAGMDLVSTWTPIKEAAVGLNGSAAKAAVKA